ncbi:golgin subfamily B member 1 isoform X2 [Stegostoma tigrinum]|uniref:golgin subfamily B member 1 isoform X2 n=1 Tax=Stegostoma tigrinum TaxID=3053191 RepID=UPI002870264C|nr:golgin subfamily B member 1 isoform X2 [Stegostoma tigrinum]
MWPLLAVKSAETETEAKTERDRGTRDSASPVPCTPLGQTPCRGPQPGSSSTMLSRLSDLAKGVNTVLQDLSGDDSGDGTSVSQEVETNQQPEVEACAKASEDVSERLAQTEQLVVQLKELIREKDLQLQSKEITIKEEKELFDAKLAKLKLQAKAKVVSLNARIEELQKQTLRIPSSQPEKTEERTTEVHVIQSSSSEQQDEIKTLKNQLDQQEENCRILQTALDSTKDQLQATNELLKQKETEHAQQLRSVQDVILEKDARFQEHIQKHEEELMQLASGSEINKELQQMVKSLQRKLEEKEEALLGRTRVVEMLQQELNDSDQKKQVLGEKLQEAEASIAMLQTALESEKLSAEAQLREVTEKYETELMEKNYIAAHMQQALQDAQSSCTDLTAQNQKLQSVMEDQERMCKKLTDEIKELQDGAKKIEANEQSEAKQTSQSETSDRVQELEEKVRLLQTAVAEQELSSQNRLAELEEEKGSLMWKTMDYEEVKTENEHLRARIKEVEQSWGTEALAQSAPGNIQHADPGSNILDTIVLEQATQSGNSSPGNTGQTNKAGVLQDNAESEPKAADLTEVQHDDAEAGECRDLYSLQKAISDKDKDLATVTQQLAEAQKEIARLNQQLFDKPGNVQLEDGTGSQVQAADVNQFLSLGQKAMSVADKNINVLIREKEGKSFVTLMEDSKNSGSEIECTNISVEIEGKTTSVVQVEQRSTTVVHLDENIYSSTELYSSGEHLGSSLISQQGLQMISGKEQDDEIVRNVHGLQMIENEEFEKLQTRIQELEKNMEAAETLYRRQLNDKQEDFTSLNQKVLSCEKEAENAKETINNLNLEKEQLLHQIQQYEDELRSVSELKEKLTKAEENAANEEKKRLLCLEQTSMQSGLLEEQLHSAENESRSKDMKIESLEKELDAIQCQVSEHDVEAKAIKAQLQEKEEAILSLKQLITDEESKVEEFMQKLASKEQELLNVQHSLSEETSKTQQLQSSLTARDIEMAELTMSMSEKMVALNEDKFSLGNEVKHLKEQLLLLQKEQEGIGGQEKPLVETKLSPQKEQMDLLQNNAAGFELLLKEKDSLVKQVENLKSENEQVKRKLQAALIKRKELLKKVEEMNQEAQKKDLQAEELSPIVPGSECSDFVSPELLTPSKEAQSQDPHSVDLIRALSEKETDLQRVSENLQDQAAKVIQLQNLVDGLKQDLQEKTDCVNSLEADVLAKQLTIQQLTSQLEAEKKCVEHEGTEVDSGRNVDESTTTMEGLAKGKQTELELKLFTLEQEKDQLQKKLEEAVSSRKDMIKKAQEKNRHHREQVKQQKEEYSILLENFNEQCLEKASISEELSKVKEQLRLLEEKCSVDVELQAGKPLHEDNVPKAAQHSGWSCEEIESSKVEPVQTFVGRSEAMSDNILVAQLKEELHMLHREKDSIMLKLEDSENLEQRAREESAGLRDQISELQRVQHLEKEELLKELDLLKKRKQEMEAEGLKVTLESAKAESSVSEHLATLNKEYGELKNILQKKDEEVEHFQIQLKEKDILLNNLQQQISDKEELVRELEMQMEQQTKEHEEQRKQLQTEILEIQQKQEEDTEEAKSKQQIQRKLQAALISRKESLKANKLLKEELASVTTLKEELSNKVREMEKTTEDLRQDKEDLLAKMSNLQEQNEKLITEVDKLLTENQNLSASCESLKLVIESVTLEKGSLQQEIEFLKGEQVAESSEWQRKHSDLQKEYETLLQCYENVGGETERIRRVLDVSKQENQELLCRIRETEAQKLELEKQVQEAAQEQEGMKEKMRKFAKSKQQKIMELEEEIEKLQSEQQPETSSQIKPSISPDSTENQLQEELQKAVRETEKVMNELEILKAQKDSLDSEVITLRQQLKDVTEKLEISEEELEKIRSCVVQGRDVQMEEAVVASLATEVKQEFSNKLGSATESPATRASPEGSQEVCDPSDLAEIASCRLELSQLTEKLTQAESGKQMLENEMSELKKMSQLLRTEKETLEEQLLKSQDELKLMQKSASEQEKDNHQIIEQVEELKREKAAAESDKDDLEERLMNQLAELNGSIANYQQELKDDSDKISCLELTVKNNQKHIDNLEEEVRHLKSEKVESAAKMQKDFEEKVKSMQRGKEGRKVHNKELQELLKVKQQEVKQLQKDCIRYQEKISGLEKTIKALEFVQQETQKNLDAAIKEKSAKIEESKKTEAELFSCKIRLDDTQSEAARILADHLKLKEELQTNEEKAQEQAHSMEEEHKRKLNREQNEHRKQLRNMQEQLEHLEREKKHAEDSIVELKDILEKKKEEASKIQTDFNENLAKLAAFTRSMSSLQNDRDRIIDESKKWEIKFNDAILKKEEEIRDKEGNCNELKEQLRQASIYSEELEIKLSRLEQSEQEWESKFKSEEEVHRQMVKKVEDENQQLFSKFEEFQKLHKDSQNELLKITEEVKSLIEKNAVLSSSLEKLETTRGELEENLRQQEAEVQNYMLTCEQLQSDLQSSKSLTDKLHKEIGEKEEKIVSLLAAKEEAVANVISEAQQQHAEDIRHWESQIQKIEDEKLEGERAVHKLQKETEDLDAKLKRTEAELKQSKVKLESFTKSMASLQDDRERVLTDYKQLEHKHIEVIVEKDQLIQEAATENNKLKNELRSQQGQKDDLNSENAKLNAQLMQYREDLNQVISMKDSQHKQLLKTQLERIKTLESEKTDIERLLKEVERGSDELSQENKALKDEKQNQKEQLQLAEKTIDELKEEVEKLTVGGPVQLLQHRLDEKTAEVEKLVTSLSSMQDKVTELELKVVTIENETEQNLRATEVRYEKELQNLQHNAGIMRNETETAEERVAELARDLMETEQRLRESIEEIEQFKAQNLSFGKAMSSLQVNRDHLLGQLEELQKKYTTDFEMEKNRSEGLYQELSQSKINFHNLQKENDRLSSELAAVKSSTIEDNLRIRIDELNKQLLSKEQDVHDLTLELESSANQLKAFSKTVTTLQEERDRLMDTVAKSKKVHEVKQGSASTSTKPSEVQSLRNALSSLQNDRDRLLEELKNLQTQYLRIGEETAELSQLRMQLEAQNQQIAEYKDTQEQLKKESVSYHEELGQLRSEKSSFTKQCERLKEQYLIAVSDKDKQIQELQSLCQELRLKAPEEAANPGEILKGLQTENSQLKSQLNNSLKELHQKELRIQKLNSKISLVFEEKVALSAQLRGTGQNLRDTQHRLNELQARHLTLEQQLQSSADLLEEKKLNPMTDAAPGGPQEKGQDEEHVKELELRHLKQRLLEAKQMHDRTEQELNQLESLLAEEQEKRLAAEEALLSAEHRLKSVELSEWVNAQERSLNTSAMEEHSMLIELPESATPSKTRRGSKVRSFCSLLQTRSRTKLLFAVYFIALHALVLLCFTGNL